MDTTNEIVRTVDLHALLVRVASGTSTVGDAQVLFDLLISASPVARAALLQREAA